MKSVLYFKAQRLKQFVIYVYGDNNYIIRK